MLTSPGSFNNQSVLILGAGNAAFEMAKAIHGEAAHVTVAGRRRIRNAWETHYPGDLRASNHELLDSCAHSYYVFDRHRSAAYLKNLSPSLSSPSEY